MMTIVLILIVLGIVGSILPALPGPIFSYAALILLFIDKGSGVISISSLVIFGLLMIVLLVADYAAPVLGAKFFGASKKGVVGAILGAILGIVFFPPLGIFIGAFLGAIIGEAYEGKDGEAAFKAGVGVILGSASVLIMQIIYSISVAIFFFLKAF